MPAGVVAFAGLVAGTLTGFLTCARRNVSIRRLARDSIRRWFVLTT